MPKEDKKSANTRLDDDEIIQTGEAVSLEEGKHEGTIKEAYGEQTPQGYKYFQLEITPDDEPEITLRYGCAIPEDGRAVTPASKLGKLLQAAGLDVTPDKQYSLKDMRDAIKGKRIRFFTMNEEVFDASNKLKGTFAKVQDNTIKFLK